MHQKSTIKRIYSIELHNCHINYIQDLKRQKYCYHHWFKLAFDGLVPDCGNYTANALELQAESSIFVNTWKFMQIQKDSKW